MSELSSILHGCYYHICNENLEIIAWKIGLIARVRRAKFDKAKPSEISRRMSAIYEYQFSILSYVSCFGKIDLNAVNNFFSIPG